VSTVTVTNEIARVLTFIVVAFVSFVVAFYGTPDLEAEEVERAVVYRFCYWLVQMRAGAFVLFDVLNLFPVE